MPIRSDIQALIDRLNQELVQIEQETNDGLDLVRPTLSRFPENFILLQFFAYLNNVMFFVDNYRGRVQQLGERFLVADTTISEIQEIGEELATMLGLVMETKIRVERIIARLRDLP